MNLLSLIIERVTGAGATRWDPDTDDDVIELRRQKEAAEVATREVQRLIDARSPTRSAIANVLSGRKEQT